MLLEMEPPDSSSPPPATPAWRRVTDPDAARTLTDPAAVDLLAPFLGRESTVARAAERLGLDVGALYYQVKRLEKLGLVRVSRLEPRPGRAIRHYRATADLFFVPLDALPLQTVEDLLERVHAHHQRELERDLAAVLRDAGLSGEWGFRVHASPSGRISSDLAVDPERPYDPRDPGGPAALDGWVNLRLGFEDAKALQRDLVELLGRYQARRGAQAYTLRVALAPRRRA
jgi:hypothetical protein